MVFSRRLAEKMPKRDKNAVRKVQSPAAILSTPEIRAYLKWKITVRGINLGGQFHQRWLVDA